MQNILIDIEDTPFLIWNKNLNTPDFVNNFLEEVKSYINNLHEVEIKSGKKAMICQTEENYSSENNHVISDTILEVNPQETFLRVNNDIIYFENNKEISLIFNIYNVNSYESTILVKDKKNQEVMVLNYCRTEGNKYSYDINKNFKESYYIYNDMDKYFEVNKKQKWSLEKNLITVFNKGVNSTYEEETQYILQDTFSIKNDEKNILKNITEEYQGNTLTYGVDLQNCNFNYIKLSEKNEFLRATVSRSVITKLRTSEILNLSNVEIKAIKDNLKETLIIEQKENTFDSIIEMLRNCYDLENLVGDDIAKDQILDVKELVAYSTKFINENKNYIFNLGTDIKSELQIINDFVLKQNIVSQSASGVFFSEFSPVFDYKSISFLGYIKMLFEDINDKTSQHLKNITAIPVEQKNKLPRYKN